VPYATSFPKEVVAVCVEEPTRQEQDLEEVRELFARYRRVAALAREMDEQQVAEADAERDSERVPAGVGA
jgi:hypothetical protein